jgi:hypothetical protein
MNILAIPIAFCLLTTILLWFIIGSKGHWVLKLVSILVCIYFSIVIWFSSCTYLGWPSKDPLPNKYVVSWAQVEEPDPNFYGAIFLWVEELESSKVLDPFYFLGYKEFLPLRSSGTLSKLLLIF